MTTDPNTVRQHSIPREDCTLLSQLPCQPSYIIDLFSGAELPQPPQIQSPHSILPHQHIHFILAMSTSTEQVPASRSINEAENDSKSAVIEPLPSSPDSSPAGPRLNSSCIFPPTVVTFQPPLFGSDFVQSSGKSDSTPASQTFPNATPPPVTMQYSIHKIPQTMRHELRAIFPELSTTNLRGSVSTTNHSSTTPTIDISSASVNSSHSDTPPRTLSLAEFKSLPILAIPTFQLAKTSLTHVEPVAEAEKNRLLESVRQTPSITFNPIARRWCAALDGTFLFSDLIVLRSSVLLLS